MEGYVAGVVPIASNEWEGTVCTLIFLAGCNFKCPYCYNGHLLDFRETFKKDLRVVKKQIAEHAPFVDGILFCGAEPTLQRQVLLDLCRYAKELGLKTGIETNGTRPSLLAELIEAKLLDHIILDLKAPLDAESMQRIAKTNAFFYPIEDVLSQIRSTLDLLKRQDVSAVVRTTIVPGLIYRREHILEMAALVASTNCVWELRPFLPQETVVSKAFHQVHPPSIDFLKEIRKSIQTTYPQMVVRLMEMREYRG